jgi:hypothetical protein
LYFWLFIATGTVFMMTPLSKPLWEIFIPLQSVQFPLRYATVLLVAVSTLAGLGFSSLKRDYYSVAFLSLFAILMGYGLVSNARQILSIYKSSKDIHPLVRKTVDLKLVSFEFTPKAVKIPDDPYTAPLSAVVDERAPLFGESQVRFLQGEGRAAVTRWEPRRITLDVEAAADSVIELRRFYYPGWDWFEPSENGLMSIKVAAGRHQIESSMRRRPPELWGLIISGLSLLVCVVVYGKVERRQKEDGS